MRGANNNNINVLADPFVPQACAKAKKHIFCEKPLATDLQGTHDAVGFAEKCGVKLMTAFQRRFDPSFARLHNIVAKGEIGQPLSAILVSRDTAPPPIAYVKGGGGVFKDQAIHDLDIARCVHLLTNMSFLEADTWYIHFHL